MTTAEDKTKTDSKFYAFFAKISDLRVEMGIADVEIIASIETPSGKLINAIHQGAEEHSEFMCAWGLGVSQARRAEIVERIRRSAFSEFENESKTQEAT